MKKTLKRDGFVLVYEWERKAVKNVNLRIRADGSVHVSSPVRVPLSFVEDFLFQNRHRIAQIQARQQERQPKQTLRIVTGESVPIFGRETLLTVQKGAYNEAVLLEDRLVLTVTDVQNEALRRRTLCVFLKQLLMEEALPICLQVGKEYAAEADIPTWSLRLRAMRSRWGSCHTEKGTVTLNLRIVHIPISFLRYVIYHEFTHFFAPDHSAAFYAHLAAHCPDWHMQKELGRHFVLPVGIWESEGS